MSGAQLAAGVVVFGLIAGVVWRTIIEHRRARGERRVWQTDIQTPPAHQNCRCTLAPVDVGPLTASIKLHDDITPTIRRIRRQLEALDDDDELGPEARRRTLEFWTSGRILRRHIERSHELTAHDIAEAKAGRVPERFIADEAMRAYAASIDAQIMGAFSPLRGDKALEEIAELEALFELEPE